MSVRYREYKKINTVEKKDPIRVLHVINGMGTGGAEKDIMNWYRNIDRSHFQFDFLVRTEDNFYKEEIESYGGHIYKVASFSKNILRNFRETKEFLKEHVSDYNVIHVHGNALIYIYPLVVAKRVGIPKRIFHCHSTKANGNFANCLHNYHKMIISRYANVLIACSKKSGEFCYRNNIYHIINNGVDIKRCRCAYKGAGLKRLGISKKCFIIGHIGRFLPVKNHKFIVDIFSYIHRYISDSNLVLIGDGPLYQNIKDYVASKGLTDFVIFMGAQSNIEELIMSMDIICFPSLYEGVPLVVLEAQAAGKKVLCSDAINQDVCITPLVHFMPLSENPESWAKEMINFSNKKICCDIERCFNDANYSIKSVVLQIENLYME